MSAPLMASNQMQANTAGQTNLTAPSPTAAAQSFTELASAAIPGESGALHFLFGNTVPTPVATATPATPVQGPNGGYGHPSAAGARVLGFPLYGAQQAAEPNGPDLGSGNQFPGVGATYSPSAISQTADTTPNQGLVDTVVGYAQGFGETLKGLIPGG